MPAKKNAFGVHNARCRKEKKEEEKERAGWEMPAGS